MDKHNGAAPEPGLKAAGSSLTAEAIRAGLTGQARGLDLIVEESVASTNSELRERADRGAREGTVILARAQSAGRGKLQRRFYSPAGSGLYLSVLLRPEGQAADWLLVGAEAAEAVSETIAAVTGVEAVLRGINDLFVGEKKVCGILTEASVPAGCPRARQVIVGIGINVYPPEGGFPAEIRASADSIFPHGPRPGEDVRARLAAELLNRFWQRYRLLGR